MKELLGIEIAKRVQNGDTLGVGTGSTVDIALQRIGERVKSEGLRISVVPSSIQTASLCESLGFTVLSPLFSRRIPWGFDGADEVDPQLRIIKGRGGALLQEKILARKCERFVILIDESKLVSKLGARSPVPVEVVPEAYRQVTRELEQLGAGSVVLREGGNKHGPVVTERGNMLLDAKFADIPDTLEGDIKKIVGVVESGLFLRYADEVLVARADRIERKVTA